MEIAMFQFAFAVVLTSKRTRYESDSTPYDGVRICEMEQ